MSTPRPHSTLELADPQMSPLTTGPPSDSQPGTWGEHNSCPEGPVSVSNGLQRFEQLARGMGDDEIGQQSSTTVDIESPHETKLSNDNPTSAGFNLRQWIENRNVDEESQGIPHKRLGLSWRNLSVHAPSGSSASFVKTLPQAILGSKHKHRCTKLAKRSTNGTPYPSSAESLPGRLNYNKKKTRKNL